MNNKAWQGIWFFVYHCYNANYPYSVYVISMAGNTFPTVYTEFACDSWFVYDVIRLPAKFCVLRFLKLNN